MGKKGRPCIVFKKENPGSIVRYGGKKLLLRTRLEKVTRTSTVAPGEGKEKSKIAEPARALAGKGEGGRLEECLFGVAP